VAATTPEVYIVENLKNLDKLPPFCFFMAFPLKVKDGSGSPVRAIGLFHKQG
jgi:kynurenine formamidase